MNKIVIVYTVQGQLIGERVDDLSPANGIKLRNPCLLVMNEKSVQFVPITQLTTDKEFRVCPEVMLFDGCYEPVTEVRNQYSTIFGSGIQVAQSMPSGSSTLLS